MILYAVFEREAREFSSYPSTYQCTLECYSNINNPSNVNSKFTTTIYRTQVRGLTFNYQERCICGHYGCVKNRSCRYEDLNEDLIARYHESGANAQFISVFFLKSAATNKHYVWSFLQYFDDSEEEITRVELLSQKQNIQWATSFFGADWFKKNMQLSNDIEVEFGGVRSVTVSMACLEIAIERHNTLPHHSLAISPLKCART